MYALVLFSTSNRPGAVEEANNLKQALQTGGFTLLGVDINGWTGLSSLELVLDSIETVAVDCCLLFVC